MITLEKRNEIADAINKDLYATSTEYWDAILEAVVQAQDTISRKAGIKTVVDWLRETGVEIEADYYPHKGEKPKIYLAVYKHRLKKKSKEWGLSDDSIR